MTIKFSFVTVLYKKHIKWSVKIKFDLLKYFSEAKKVKSTYPIVDGMSLKIMFKQIKLM